MKRIAIEGFNIKQNNTGIGYYTKSLFENINKINLDNEIILYANKDLKNNISYENTKYFSIKNKVKEALLRHLQISKTCRHDSIDLYHGTAFSIPINIKSKTVLTVHDLSFLKYPETFTKSRLLYGKLYIESSIKRADKIIAVSNSTKKDIMDFYNIDEKKIEVVYLGSRDIFKPSTKEEIQKIKKKYNVSKYILAVGTIEPRKNLISLFRAYKNIINNIDDDFKLILVGKKGWMFDDIFNEMSQLKDKIIITGYISDEELRILYGGSEVFIYPSIYEGFGLPVLEAMSCGTPVITSNVSSLPEVVGDAGILVDPLNIEEISFELMNIINMEKNNKELLRKKSLEQSKKFSWEKCAKETIEIYNDLLK